jgi:hypothetical protein
VYVGEHKNEWGVFSLFVHYRPEYDKREMVAVYGCNDSDYPDYQSGEACDYRQADRDGYISPVRVALENAIKLGVPGFTPDLIKEER